MTLVALQGERLKSNLIISGSLEKPRWKRQRERRKTERNNGYALALISAFLYVS